MKILHVVEPFSSGIITFIIHLTKEITQHQHIVLHGSRTSADEEDAVKQRFPNSVKFIKWGAVQRNINPINDVIALWQLLKVIRNGEFDFIHLHSAKAGFLGRLAARILGIQNIIYTPNGAPFLRQDVSSVKQKLFEKLEKLGSRTSGQVISCSKSEQDAYLMVGIPSLLINNGTNILNHTKQSHQKLIVASVGIATYQKNPWLFNEIAQNFVENDNVVFVWVGGGDLTSVLTSPNIKITGWLNTQEVETWLSKIDIYLSCSLWEGLPFAVLEAMSWKCALLLNSCVGNKDLVVQAKNGFLFNNASEAIDLLSKMISDKQKLIEMGNESFRLLERNFNIKDTAKAYLNIYNNA